MINCNCDNCKKDASGDYIYCSKCYSNLEAEIGDLKDRIYEMTGEIEQLHEEIKILENNNA